MPLAGLSKHQQHHRMHVFFVFFFLGGGQGAGEPCRERVVKEC